MSPTIGPLGSRACQEIVDAARRLFIEHGYHGTSILAIAEATGRSDTAVYQYFQGKQELFRIFVEELADDLVEHFEGLRTLTDGPAGLADLRAWLDGLGTVLLERHSPVFVEWPLPAEGETPVENPTEQYLRTLGALLDSRLAFADTGGVAPRVLPIAVMCLMQYSHVVVYAQRGQPGMPAAEKAALHNTLAAMIHRSLFPSAGPPRRDKTLGTGRTPRPDLARPDRHGTPHLPGLRKAVTTPRTRRTVEKLAAAAVTAFERRGLSGTSVNDIVAEAGVAHGTFYQYWADRPAVFATLAVRAGALTCDCFDALAEAATVEDVLLWLERWLDVVERWGAVFHIWTIEILEAPPLWPLAMELRTYLEGVTAVLLERWGTASALDHRTGTTVLWTLLTEFPYTAWHRHGVLTREQALSCQALLLVRGLLGQPGTALAAWRHGDR